MSSPKQMSVYLAGPMRGMPEWNFPAFDAATEDLRARGIDVWSPAEYDREVLGVTPETTPEGLPLRDYMKVDLQKVLESDAIVVLPGWENSQGASLEVHVARECSIPVHSYPDLSPVEAKRHPNSERFHELLREAGTLHDRKQTDYGKGDDPFANVRASSEWGLPAWVGAMVRLTDKVRRLQTLATRGELANEAAVDSFMDISVYALIARVLYEQERVA